jgi:hypothetical protein
MRRREFLTLLGGAPIANIVHAQSRRLMRLAVVMGNPDGDPRAEVNLAALRDGLRSLGWIEGKNIRLDYRLAGGGPELARPKRRRLLALFGHGAMSTLNPLSMVAVWSGGRGDPRLQQPTQQRAATARQTGVSSGPACPLLWGESDM